MEVIKGRMYDYNNGRFLSVDPFIQSPTSTQSMNPYTYIFNNPLSGVDPTGYMSIGQYGASINGDTCGLYCFNKEKAAKKSGKGKDDGSGSKSNNGDNSELGSQTKASMNDLKRIIFNGESRDDVLGIQDSEVQTVDNQSSICKIMICVNGSDIARSGYSGIKDTQETALPYIEAVDVLTTPPSIDEVVFGIATAGAYTYYKRGKKLDGAIGGNNDTNYIYSARELNRRAEETGPFHNFPEAFNTEILSGTRTAVSSNYIQYTKRGTIVLPGKPIYGQRSTMVGGKQAHEIIGHTPSRTIQGTYEIGVKPSASGRTEVITHRFFRSDE